MQSNDEMQTESSGASVRPALLLATLGVVYGDIGTSPLYALRECFQAGHGVPTTPDNILGVVSLIFWSLTVIVSVKYLGLILRADNRGEGGVLALLSLAIPKQEGPLPPATRLLTGVGVFGAALLYGDGMITPAISVLGAIEGLEVVTPVFQPYVTPLAAMVLVALFSVQRFGTGGVGRVFGPVMLVWFTVLALLGLRGIAQAPEILWGLSPHHGIQFLWREGPRAFVVLGAVFLVVTGAEALYADMGHFGRRPIRRAWFGAVLPGLLLNYFGEGALLLRQPEAARNPFYLLAPSWAVLPLVVLATAAAVIASQALISGTYSITMQAVQMGYLPRLLVRHTSRSERGQIYMPQVNGFLMVACVGMVLGFQSSSRLAGAYGIAVSLTMIATTCLFFVAARRLWHWSLGRALGVCGAFLGIEMAFAAANGLKLLHGGWFPLVVGVFVFYQMTTWRQGRQRLRAQLGESTLPLERFLEDLERTAVPRVPGTAVFMSGNPAGTPLALLHNLRHNHVLHRRIVILTVLTVEVPFVSAAERVQVEILRPDLYRVFGRYGFMEQPHVPALLQACAPFGLACDPMECTFFLSRETIVPKAGPGMARWRRTLFAAMARNAQSATAFFELPPNRVVELGMQIEI